MRNKSDKEYIANFVYEICNTTQSIPSSILFNGLIGSIITISAERGVVEQTIQALKGAIELIEENREKLTELRFLNESNNSVKH